MGRKIGTLLFLASFLGSVRLAKKMIEKNLDAGSDAVLRARGDVVMGCMFEKGIIANWAVEAPICCYSGDKNNMTVCAEDVYPGDGGECRSKDMHRVVREGDAFTGECILLLWNITKKDEGTYLAVFPGQREHNQPMEIKIKKDIPAMLEEYHKSKVNSSLSQCQKQVESASALLETEKTENGKLLEAEKNEKWKLLEAERDEKWQWQIIALVLALILALAFIAYLVIHCTKKRCQCCQCKNESMLLPTDRFQNADEYRCRNGEPTEGKETKKEQ